MRGLLTGRFGAGSMKNLIFLDTETTGKGPEDRILEIAISQNKGGDIWSERCKPPVKIDFEAMATHHITEKMVEGLGDFSKTSAYNVLQHLAQAPYSVIIAHNAAFDLEMLKREGLVFPQYICTLKVARAIGLDFPSYKLQYLRYALELEIDGDAHSAGGDVAVLKELFDYLVVMLYQARCENYEKTIEYMIDVSSKPSLLKRLSFGKWKGEEFETVERGYLEWLVKQQDVDEDVMFTAKYWLNKR